MIYDSMKDCYANLKDNVNYCLDNTNLNNIFNILDTIKGPTIVCGVGGSSAVGVFLCKVLNKKNNIIATFVSPRDLAYMDLSGYQNIIGVSYSGTNLVAKCTLETNLNKYLLTGNSLDKFTCLSYKVKPEVSYVSISNTIAPMALILTYYRNDRNLINKILDLDIVTSSNNKAYEILSGQEYKTAEVLLESALVESGMATCVVHDKYSYCHGRINITRNSDADLIFLKSNNELDELFNKVLPKYYKNIITIDTKYEDEIINDFYASIIGIKLAIHIAQNHNWDLSNIKELEDNDLFYLYKGSMK